MTTFTAHCAKGHDRIDFDGDREAFEAHMISEHGAKKLHAGGPVVPLEGDRAIAAPGWRNGRIEAPYAWVAPRATPGGLAKVVERIERGDYDIKLHWTDEEPTRLGEAVA